MRLKDFFWMAVFFSLLALPLVDAFSSGDLYLSPASAGATSYTCDGSETDCRYTPCKIIEGQTYWVCSADSASYSCSDFASCFTQDSYAGTPPPVATYYEGSADGSVLKFKFGVMHNIGSGNIIRLSFNRDAGASPYGYFEVIDVRTEKHGCYAIDTSSSGGCADITANEHIKGWHSSQGALILAWNGFLSPFIWGLSGLEVGLAGNLKINISSLKANFDVPAVSVGGNLTVSGRIFDSSGSVESESLNITGGLVVTGLSDLGDVKILKNDSSSITFNDSVSVSGGFNTSDVIASSLQTDDVVTSSIQASNVFSSGVVSDGNVRGTLRGKLEISGSCVMQESDGSIAVLLGGC